MNASSIIRIAELPLK